MFCIPFFYRRSLKTPNHDDEIPGAPKKAEQLFVPRRSSRRRSSAILNCNAAAVVKAVLLLRRNSGAEPDNKPSFHFPAKRSASFNTSEILKSRSAPSRESRLKLNETTKSPAIAHRAKSSRNSGSRALVFANANKRSPSSNVRSAKKVDTSDTGRNKINQIKRLSKEKKTKNLKAGFEKTATTESSKMHLREATINVVSRANSPSVLPSVGLEKSVVQKPNVVIKEIINTGIPGRLFSPKSYRRFDKSIFDVLDSTSNPEASSSDEDAPPAKSPGLNPWSISLAASKWMTNVRQRRRNTHAQEVIDDTGQPPIIVIEDWSPDAKPDSEGSEDTDASQLTINRKTPTRKMSRTPTPVLDDVTEESEEEIQKYEDELVPSERYHDLNNFL